MNYNTYIKDLTGNQIGLCVGLDPVVKSMPAKFHNHPDPLLAFNLDIIEATLDVAACYKPNLAFYEAYGSHGWRQLEETIKAIPDNKLVIADGKRGDIGNTAQAYATGIFEKLGARAATVNSYLGSDSLEPFLNRPENGVFVLAVTTNVGGADVQNLICDGIPVFRHVIKMCRKINLNKNVGIVVGATKPELIPLILEEAVDLPLLIPGIGAQGGDVDLILNHLKNYEAPKFVNASRSILYGSRGDDYQSSARIEAFKLYEMLNKNY